MGNRLRALAAELARRGQLRRGEDPADVARHKVARLRADTFPEQLAFVDAPDKRHAIGLARRGGKTGGILRRALIRMLMVPGYQAVYLGTKQKNAKEIVDAPLRRMDATYDLALQINGSALTYTMPNGSRLRLLGLNDAGQVDNLRGNPHDMIVVDETQSVRADVEEFIQSVALPSLMDRRGELILGGTPDPKRVNKTWFAAISGSDKRWRRWWWPLEANRFLLDPKSYLAEMLTTEGYTEDDPRFRAEFLGDVNAFDSVNLMIRDYQRERNWTPTPPAGKMHYICGYDIGLVDKAAYVVFGYSFVDRRVYIVETFARSHMDVTEQGQHLEALAVKYEFLDVVADEGALGKLIALEIGNRFPGLSIQAADKTDKALQVKLMNTDFRTGRLQLAGPPSAHASTSLKPGKEAATDHDEIRIVKQWSSTTWDERHQREQEGQEVDLFDAALYGWRACKTYYDHVAPKPPVDEWEQKITEAAQGKRTQHFKRGQ